MAVNISCSSCPTGQFKENRLKGLAAYQSVKIIQLHRDEVHYADSESPAGMSRLEHGCSALKHHLMR